MDITSLTGDQLLVVENLEAIKKEVDLILQNKDVAMAWRVVRHIKTQLSALPPAKVTPVLNDYRRLTSALKILALPLLDGEEVKTLISKNIFFIEDKYLPILAATLPVWLASLDDNAKEKMRAELLELLPLTSPLRLGLTEATASIQQVNAGPKEVSISHGDIFDKDEIAELDNHVKKVNDIGGSPLLHDGPSVAEAILKEVGAQADKETWLRRANALITSRLRDVRTKMDLREYLQRPFTVGGLSLSGDKLDRASKLVEEEYAKLHDPALSAKPVEPVVAPSAPIELATPIDLSSLEPAPTPTIELPPINSAPIIAAIPKIEEKIEKVPEPIVIVPPAPVAPVELAPALESVENNLPRPVRPVRTAPINNKPRVDDIRMATRTATSADELKFLTLADWRKYNNLAVAVESILKKINILDQAGAIGKMRNIKLFKESELFKQYVALGQASLTQGKKLADALTDVTINPAGFTEDEFFSIASLNSKLK